MTTRILIDGIPVNSRVTEGRFTSFNTPYFTELSAGSHTIAVEYKTDSAITSAPNGDPQSRHLQVLVFGSD